MVSFFAFLLFQPFCLTNLPASLSIVKRACKLALQFDRPSNLSGRLAFSLLATLECYVFNNSKEARRSTGQQGWKKAGQLGGWKVNRPRRLEGEPTKNWKAGWLGGWKASRPRRLEDESARRQEGRPTIQPGDWKVSRLGCWKTGPIRRLEEEKCIKRHRVESDLAAC
ncbi:hypothetical protein SESBI_31077 [Sesbania bispinosa]|nr:hypothetical protein SESBI_31077 [Sesbania bispinosa]